MSHQRRTLWKSAAVGPSTVLSMAASCLFVGDRAGVLHPCLGVDIQAPRPAPVGERFGIDVGADDRVPFAPKLLLACLGLHPPFVERSDRKSVV